MQLLMRTSLLFVFSVMCPNLGASTDRMLNAAAIPHNYQPSAGYVPNAQVATKIAEAVLFEIYGEKAIRRQMPFQISRRGDVWFVSGQLPKSAHIKGGVVEIEISSRNGKILRISHGV